MKFKLVIVLLFVGLLLSCETDTPENNSQKIIDVYVAGNKINDAYQTRAFYWKNNIVNYLTNANVISEANSIYVSENDVYVGGLIKNSLTDESKAVYWKNGILTELSTIENYDAKVTDIKFVNGSVYASGFDDYKIVYWKDGVKTILADQGSGYTVPKIEVIGNDVYVSGEMDLKPAYWKNGVLNTLSTYDGYTFDLRVKNNDVYVAGIIIVSVGSYVPLYWKNDTINYINGSYLLYGIDISSANEIYVSGYDGNYQSAYWKNETKTLVYPENGYIVSKIKTIDNLVFACGETKDSEPNTKSIIYINGVLTLLDNSKANSIFVVQKQ